MLINVLTSGQSVQTTNIYVHFIFLQKNLKLNIHKNNETKNLKTRKKTIKKVEQKTNKEHISFYRVKRISTSAPRHPSILCSSLHSASSSSYITINTSGWYEHPLCVIMYRLNYLVSREFL